MPQVSTNDFISWRERQILKGGDFQSLDLLIDSVGDFSKENYSFIKLSLKKYFELEVTLETLEVLWDKHLNTNMPIQYLSGISFWRDLKLEVSDKVLIPRSETELIIDIIQANFIPKCNEVNFADLGTGSGAIGIALALAKPCWNGIATDIDKKAIEIASRNFDKFSNKSNLKFFCGNWWDPLKNYRGQIDLAVANPPYIPSDVYQNLPKGVKFFEPKIALLGGEDGLDHIKVIIKNAPKYLKKGGYLLIENHFDQGREVEKLFLENGFEAVKVLKDFCGIERFTIGRSKDYVF